MTRRYHPKKSGALLAAALLTSSFTSALAGPETKSTGGKTVAEKPADSNPLSFLGGKLVFDVQERLRLEAHENHFDFNDDLNTVNDDWFLLQRFRLGVLVKPVSWLKIYAQGQDAQEIDSEREDVPGVLGAEGDDIFDLRQAWIEIGNPKDFPLTLKVGRQILSYGDERLVGGFDWNNISRVFDAVKLRWEIPGWSVDAFASSVVVPRADSFNKSDVFHEDDVPVTDSTFYGLYASSTALLPWQVTDVYAFGLHTDQELDEGIAPRSTDTHFATVGFRMKSKPGAFAPEPDGKAVMDGKSVADGKSALPPAAKKPVGLDYTLEAAFQTGEVRDLDLTAFAAHLDVGYTFDTAVRPRVALGYSFATGDSTSSDTRIETFQNLFPTNHKFYGQMDVFSWQNIHDLELDFKIAPIKSVTLRADFHAFFLATNEDAWYRANGATAVRPLDARARDAGKYTGSEIDFLATWAVNKFLVVEAGYSRFFAGEYLKDTGASDDADFAYFQATLTF